MTHRELAELAYGMLDRSYSPYSKFPVGAALLCAERTALVTAVSEGVREFVTLAVVGRGEDFCWPCGACRQMLREFAPNLEVVVGNGKKELTVIPLPELLPHSFGPESLT